MLFRYAHYHLPSDTPDKVDRGDSLASPREWNGWCARLRRSEDCLSLLLTACGLRGLERVVPKGADSQYWSGRSRDWIKAKCAAWREAGMSYTSAPEILVAPKRVCA